MEQGRPVQQPGAHVEGHNATTIGICLAGGVAANGKTPENNFTIEQFESLEALVGDLTFRFGDVEVLGHRDFKGVRKECPCFDVREWYASLTGETK